MQNGVVAIILVVLIGSLLFYCGCMTAQPTHAESKTEPATDHVGWRLGTQAYTFRLFSFFEAVDKTSQLGLRWIEAYPGQKFSLEHPDKQFHHTMSQELRNEAKAKLLASGIQLVNYGVVGLPNDEAQCRQVFDFAKDMGIETIVSEPTEETFDLIDRLCQEYRINVAIHNHPEPSHYWHPDTVLKVCEKRSSWIGACADTGHWTRSGIHPVEAIKKLKGRIKSLHLKDLNEFGKKEAHDVIWGTGQSDLVNVLAELHQQNFQGVFSVEYEHNWENSVPEIRRSAEFFNQQAAKLNSSR